MLLSLAPGVLAPDAECHYVAPPLRHVLPLALPPAQVLVVHADEPGERGSRRRRPVQSRCGHRC